MSPSYWGPNTWVFIHTLAAKIREDSFPSIGPNLIFVIMQICSNLPCPECAQHAKKFWAKVKTANIKNKDDLINLLYVFHNTVNKRRSTPQFLYENLTIYDKKNVVDAFNAFARTFNTRGNMQLINESFHRNLMLASLRTWLITNIKHFEPPRL
jgi:hypothetical protein